MLFRQKIHNKGTYVTFTIKTINHLLNKNQLKAIFKEKSAYETLLSVTLRLREAFLAWIEIKNFLVSCSLYRCAVFYCLLAIFNQFEVWQSPTELILSITTVRCHNILNLHKSGFLAELWHVSLWNYFIVK